jgi:hypothetical protein
VGNKFSYFFQTLVVICISALCFLLFKEVLPKRIFSEAKPSAKNVVVDSILLEAVALDEKTKSTAEKGVDTFRRKKIVFEQIDGIAFPPEEYEQYKGFQFLIPFFEKLYLLETEQKGDIRIAYFGDSMTDGDLIVQDFRNALQSQYGGKGVGFVSITESIDTNTPLGSAVFTLTG